jgi:hypothetical protein
VWSEEDFPKRLTRIGLVAILHSLAFVSAQKNSWITGHSVGTGTVPKCRTKHFQGCRLILFVPRCCNRSVKNKKIIGDNRILFHTEYREQVIYTEKILVIRTR